MAINDLKKRLKEEYTINKDLCNWYVKNHKDFDDKFKQARARNSEIVEYLHLVFKMSYDSVIDYLER